MVLVERNRFGGSAELDRVQLNLEYLASGSIQQEVSFAERDGLVLYLTPTPTPALTLALTSHPTPAPN